MGIRTLGTQNVTSLTAASGAVGSLASPLSSSTHWPPLRFWPLHQFASRVHLPQVGRSTRARFKDAADFTLPLSPCSIRQPPDADTWRGVPGCWGHLDLAVCADRHRERRRDFVSGLREVSHSARQRLRLSGRRLLWVLPRLRHPRSQERGLSHRPHLFVDDSGKTSSPRSSFLGVHLLVTVALH